MMRALITLFLLLTLPVLAQETQVPLDVEGKLLVLDAELERRLQLFAPYPDFREARLYQTNDTSYVLEVQYAHQGALLRDRLSYSAADVFALRERVTARLRDFAPRVGLNQEGRTRLLVGNLLLSLGYYGWALPYVAKVDDGTAYGGTYLIVSAAGFFVPYLITDRSRVTKAAASLSFYGGTRGIVHGIYFHDFFRGSRAAFRESGDDLTRGQIATGLLFSLSESVLGYVIAHANDMSAGTADVIGVGGDFGLGWGLVTADLAEWSDGEHRGEIGAAVLLGSAVGLAGGKLLANQQPYTTGDAFVLRGAGYLGAFVPMAIVSISETDEDDAYTTAAMIGSAVGLGVGQALVRGKDFTSNQGYLTVLGEFAGGLVGLGIGVLAASGKEDEDQARPIYLVSTAVGAVGGFTAVYLSQAKDAGVKPRKASFRMDVTPSLVGAQLSSGHRLYGRPTVPGLTVAIAF